MQILRRTLCLIRRPSVATFPPPMPRLSSCSRPLRSFMASATPRWWPPALTRRVCPLMVYNPPRVFQFPCEPGNMSTMRQVKGHESGKQYRGPTTTPADVGNQHSLVTPEDQCGEIVVDDTMNPLAESGHRDGSIYTDMNIWWKKIYRIADRNETRLEAMSLSDPTDCILYDGTCIKHYPGSMLQIFSIEVAKLYVDGGLAELYGYIAVRDSVDPLLNYIVNISREDPVTVEQGCLINMIGPKRGINFWDLALIEYDMRIKISEQETYDLELIDGASIVDSDSRDPYTICFRGDCGTIAFTSAWLLNSVEATIAVLVSEVQSSFNLSLSCLTSGLDKEIRLFDGGIAESCGLKRFVVAAVIRSLIDLKFEVGVLPSSSERHLCSFKPRTHGHDTQEIKTHFALISVKVTWSTLPLRTCWCL